MNVHFIAIGGSAMHNLAIALHKKNYKITGSDDQVFEPSRSRLQTHGLLPSEMGWNENHIHSNLDAVILGMHAKADNPELLRAKELGLAIYSYPEFLYNQSRNKTRIVIGGSHGKTTITSIILHVLQHHGIDIDYMVGAQLDGFDVMVKLSDDAPFIILEGDEYLSSPIDLRPKFHLYQPHIALLSGIAWDHINVFPTFENYLEQFKIFIDLIKPNGKLIYCKEDEILQKLCEEETKEDIHLYSYTYPEHEIKNGKTFIKQNGSSYPLEIFGKHNLLNISGAMVVCNQMGISDSMFMEAIVSFRGASNRLQLISQSEDTVVFKDFAHAPSKLKATTKAVKEQFSGRKLIAVMELHTYSSLSKEFLIQYKDSMIDADYAIVFYNPHALQLKRLPPINPRDIKDAFGGDNIEVINDASELGKRILDNKQPNSAFLFMSSGDFGQIDLVKTAHQLTQKN
ncbi:MAG: peptidoglycan synthetase [Bacteroidetes bacterium]|nr:MAG: peptidoglycan synthetase [Bacteroidota bacterium]